MHLLYESKTSYSVGAEQGPASALTSTITAAPTSIAADGAATSTVTVQLKDASGNDLTTGGDAVTLATTLGTLGAVTDNGDGTYTATLTSGTTAGTATVTGTVNTVAITDNATVAFTVGAASAATSTITAAPTSIAADGAATSTITVQLKDANGNDLTAGGDAVTLATTLGTLGAVTDNTDGTYTATLTSGTTAGTATVTGTVNTVAITDNAVVTFTVGAASAVTSTITAAPASITADGASTSTVTVQLKDAGGNNLATGGDAVTLATTLGTLGAVTDNGDGTYTATLTSGTTAGTATVTGTVNTVAITDNAAVAFTVGAASALTSTITAAPASITAEGASTSTVTVQLKDAVGNNLATGGDAVTLATTLGTLGAVTDNGDGTYTATLTSGTTAGTATVTGTANTAAITDNAAVAFSMQLRRLTIISSGDGDGAVRSQPFGIDCLIAGLLAGGSAGGDCDQNYSDGTLVTLSATPVIGSAFAGWQSVCVGTGPCVVGMDQDRTITANFQQVAEPDADDAAQHLLGRPRLTSIELLFLDQWGNHSDTYDLGDFLALLNRTGQIASAAIMTRVLELPPPRQDPASDGGASERGLPRLGAER